MQFSNRLFFEQVEAMLAEGREVEIRMKGESMRPLLRNERDRAVLAPCPDPTVLRPGDIVLFRSGDRHILHRIVAVDSVPETAASVHAETDRTEAHIPSDTPASGKRSFGTSAPPIGERSGDTFAPAAPLNREHSGDTFAPAEPLNREHSGDTFAPAEPPAGQRSGDTSAPSAPLTGQRSGETFAPAATTCYTLAGDGNYRLREQCRAEDIVAVLVRVIRPSGRVVKCRSRRWRWQSRLWLALPAALRRIALGALRRFGIG